VVTEGALTIAHWHAYTESTVKHIIQVRITKGEKQFVAECLDLPVVAQGRTLDEVTANVREAISLHLRGEDLAELGLADQPSVLASYELEPHLHPHFYTENR
jgi:predicted RNase H-like HicB family nuclease